MTRDATGPRPHLPFAVILRLSDVVLSKKELEAALGTKIYRYEAARAGSLHDAHIDVMDGDIDALAADGLWAEIADGIGRVGPAIRKLKQNRAIGRASLDLAVSFPDASWLVSYGLPSHVAKVVGQHDIDIEFSVYRGDGEATER
jgi:hypothetical protein